MSAPTRICALLVGCLAFGTVGCDATVGVGYRYPHHHRPYYRHPPYHHHHYYEHHYYDDHYGHNRYYYEYGYAVTTLPRGYVRIDVHDDPYYYCEGDWYRHGSRGYVAGRAPIGARIRKLPPHCSRVHVRGREYFYANRTYYEWHPRSSAYVVVNVPLD